MYLHASLNLRDADTRHGVLNPVSGLHEIRIVDAEYTDRIQLRIIGHRQELRNLAHFILDRVPPRGES